LGGVVRDGDVAREVGRVLGLAVEPLARAASCTAIW